jgi:hypothetical protein
MGIVQNVLKKPRSKPRVFKTASGIVTSENIKGRSVGRGGTLDQRAKPFGSRPLKGGGRKVRNLNVY